MKNVKDQVYAALCTVSENVSDAYPRSWAEGSMMDVNGKTEYIPMGYFTAGKPQKADDQITFTAYDRMMKTERTFSMSGSNTDTVNVLKKIAEITGVPVTTAGFTAISMKVPKGYSCREVLSYVAQLHGSFAVCNRKGQIELHTYADSGYKVKPGRYWGNFEHKAQLDLRVHKAYRV